MAISEEHGFSFCRDVARILLGWARAQLGAGGEGVSLVRQGLAGKIEVGARLAFTEIVTYLAEAQGLDRLIDDALITIEDAIQADPEELVSRPEAFRVRGELRLKIGQTELAEADFRKAIALAQKMSAKAFGLRAAMSLARLLDTQGKRQAARAMLAEIYNWFTEGLDTKPLKDAKALLDKLSA